MKIGAYLTGLLGRWRPNAGRREDDGPTTEPDPTGGRAAAVSWLNEGIARYDQDQLEAAARCLERALADAHDLAPVHYYFGLIAARRGKLEDALDCYHLATHYAPEFAAAHRETGATLTRLHRLEQAAEACERACALDPAEPANHFAAAGAAKARGALAAAVRHYRAALELDPGYAEALCNLGWVLDQLGRCEEAAQCYDRALAIEPEFVEVIHNQGLLARDSGDLGRALSCFRRALGLRPDSADIRFNHAIALLASGEFARGWCEFESRFEQSRGAARRRPFSYPVWRGEDLTGKTLLVWGEQGIGDEILYAALYGELLARAGQCIFECSPKLVALVARSFPRAIVVPRMDPPHSATRQGVDYHIAAGSLPLHLRPTAGSFPREAGYLSADEAGIGRWRRQLEDLGPGLKVGFAWRSGNLQGKRALACPLLEHWGELFRAPAVQWICLQYGECREELEAARRRFGVQLHRFEDMDYFNDLDGVSALMKALDLVVSAPTVVSLHAAALGVEVCQMSYGTDWQAHGTQGNLWYPSLTRYERRWDQEWGEVLGHVAQRLRERAGR